MFLNCSPPFLIGRVSLELDLTNLCKKEKKLASVLQEMCLSLSLCAEITIMQPYQAFCGETQAIRTQILLDVQQAVFN